MLEIDRYSNRVRYKILRDGELMLKEISEFTETDTPLCSYEKCLNEATASGMATVRSKRGLRQVKLILCELHSNMLMSNSLGRRVN